MNTELGKHNEEMIAQARERCRACKKTECPGYDPERSFTTLSLQCFVDSGEAGPVHE